MAVLDVTNPAFAIGLTEPELAALEKEFVRDDDIPLEARSDQSRRSRERHRSPDCSVLCRGGDQTAPGRRGPAFGERAFQALAVTDGPLDGLDVTFRRLRYDWHHSATAPGDARRHAQIRANLESLHSSTSPDAVVAGSVTRDGPAGWTVGESIERPFSYNVALRKP